MLDILTRNIPKCPLLQCLCMVTHDNVVFAVLTRHMDVYIVSDTVKWLTAIHSLKKNGKQETKTFLLRFPSPEKHEMNANDINYKKCRLSTMIVLHTVQLSLKWNELVFGWTISIIHHKAKLNVVLMRGKPEGLTDLLTVAKPVGRQCQFATENKL